MTSKYEGIADKLETEIRQMMRDGRDRLPSESDLCSKYSCSRQTVRMALSLLEDRGMIVKKKGSGSFIAPRVSSNANTVFFITEDEDRYTSPAFIQGLKAQLHGRKFELKCFSTNGFVSTEGEILRKAVREMPFALIIEPLHNVIPNPNIPLILEARSKGIPVIYLNSAYRFPEDALLISADNTEGAEMLVRHLAQEGHKRIGGIFRIDDTEGLEKYKGCMKACNELGLPFDETGYYLFRTDELNDLIRGERGFLRRFADGCLRNKTAVICHDDMIAYQLITMIRKGGKRVPEDIAVVSFDNSYYAAQGDVGITSAGLPERSLARACADAVFAIADGKTYRSRRLPWEITVRKSG